MTLLQSPFKPPESCPLKTTAPGAFYLTCAGDLPLASIATRDIASTATSLLTDLSWTGQENLPVFGPDRLTPDGMAEMLRQNRNSMPYVPAVYLRCTLVYFSWTRTAGGACRRAPRQARTYSPSWRAMSIRCTSLVPSPISRIFASR